MPECLLYLPDPLTGALPMRFPTAGRSGKPGAPMHRKVSPATPIAWRARLKPPRAYRLSQPGAESLRSSAAARRGSAGLSPQQHQQLCQKLVRLCGAQRHRRKSARTAITAIWPYESWGPEQRLDLWWKVDFGRPVELDKIRLMLRADFPTTAIGRAPMWSSPMEAM